jgi:hypothetical protein
LKHWALEKQSDRKRYGNETEFETILLVVWQALIRQSSQRFGELQVGKSFFGFLCLLPDAHLSLYFPDLSSQYPDFIRVSGSLCETDAIFHLCQTDQTWDIFLHRIPLHHGTGISLKVLSGQIGLHESGIIG